MSLPWLSDPRRPLTSPRELPKLEAWYDSLDPITLLASDGNIVTDGGTVCLWKDKSGNSGVNALVLPGVAGNYASTPDASAIDITGDLDIRVDLAADDWTPAVDMGLVSKFETNASYLLRLEATTGNLRLFWIQADGTFINKTSTAAPAFSNYSRGWVRATLDVDNGSTQNEVKFYTSTDGSTWTQLGATVTTAGVTNIRNQTSVLQIGAQGTDEFIGRIYRAQIYASTDGTDKRIDIDFTAAPTKLANGDTFVCTTGQTVTLNSSGATGARIAGERDLFQGTAANRPVLLKYSGTKYGYLNGTAGNYFSTPDSAAVNTFDSGAIDVRFYYPGGGTWDWTPAATQELVVKWDGGASKKGYLLRFNSAGVMTFLVSANGTTETGNTVCSAPVTLANNTAGWVRVTYVFATGKANYYESTDGTNWTAVGVEQTSAAAVTPFVSNTALNVGNREGSVMTGNVGRAQIYDGIGGTLVADFNPALYTSGTTFTASTGEVWTLNGGAHIVTRTGLYFDGSNDYLKSAAFSLSQPETVYFVGSQVTWTSSDVLYCGNANDSGIIYQTPTSPNLSAFAGAALALGTPLSLKTAGVVSVVFNSTTSSIRLNRNALSSGDSGTANLLGFTLGSNGNGGSGWSNITASEILIRSAADNTATQDRIALYAGRKWGFTV